ncbi:MAG: anti-sigma factor [Pseudonocardia sp.]
MTGTRDVACRELVELVTEYLEDALPRDEAAAVEAHLADCPPCRAYLAQMRATIAVTGTVDVETLPEEVVEGLLRAFRHARD